MIQVIQKKQLVSQPGVVFQGFFCFCFFFFKAKECEETHIGGEDKTSWVPFWGWLPSKNSLF